LEESEIRDDVYYYTFDGDNIYVTKYELERNSAKLQQQINTLFKGGTPEDIENTLETIFVPIEIWNSFQEEYQRLSTLVQDLELRLLKVEPIKVITSEDSIIVTGDPDRCYVDEDTIYIQSDNIIML
jgi:hypothetical protein